MEREEEEEKEVMPFTKVNFVVCSSGISISVSGLGHGKGGKKRAWKKYGGRFSQLRGIK